MRTNKMLILIGHNTDRGHLVSTIESNRCLTGFADLLYYHTGEDLVGLGDLRYLSSDINCCEKNNDGPHPRVGGLEEMTSALTCDRVKIDHRFAYRNGIWYFFVEGKMIPISFLIDDSKEIVHK